MGFHGIYIGFMELRWETNDGIAKCIQMWNSYGSHGPFRAKLSRPTRNGDVPELDWITRGCIVTTIIRWTTKSPSYGRKHRFLGGSEVVEPMDSAKFNDLPPGNLPMCYWKAPFWHRDVSFLFKRALAFASNKFATRVTATISHVTHVVSMIFSWNISISVGAFHGFPQVWWPRLYRRDGHRHCTILRFTAVALDGVAWLQCGGAVQLQQSTWGMAEPGRSGSKFRWWSKDVESTVLSFEVNIIWSMRISNKHIVYDIAAHDGFPWPPM